MPRRVGHRYSKWHLAIFNCNSAVWNWPLKSPRWGYDWVCVGVIVAPVWQVAAAEVVSGHCNFPWCTVEATVVKSCAYQECQYLQAAPLLSPWGSCFTFSLYQLSDWHYSLGFVLCFCVRQAQFFLVWFSIFIGNIFSISNFTWDIWKSHECMESELHMYNIVGKNIVLIVKYARV